MTTAYPPALRSELQDSINGFLVADPYRWLEDPGSEETRAWLAAQDALYAEQLAALPGREALAKRLAELLGAGTVSTPVWRGERQFFLRRMPGQEHAVLYTATADGGERVLIDPMQVDPSGTTTLDAWQPDKEGRLLAYQLSEAARRSRCCASSMSRPARMWTARSTAAGTAGWRGCRAARRSTTRAGSRPVMFLLVRSSITGGSTCTGPERPPMTTS